ncbi:MAG: hypothetical protein ACK44H_08970 [Candidatus Kryptonium sp.]
MAKFSDDKIVHLMSGSKRYITILPYEEFLRIKSFLKKSEEEPSFDLRFRESVLLELLELFKGDLIKIGELIDEINRLKYDPFPLESVKVGYRVCKILINNADVSYTVNKQRRLITVLSILHK